MRADVGDLPFQVISSDQVRGVPPGATPGSPPTPTGPKGQRIPKLHYPRRLLLHMSVTSSFFQKWWVQGLNDSQVSNFTIRSRQKMQSTKESTPHTLHTYIHLPHTLSHSTPHSHHTHCIHSYHELHTFLPHTTPHTLPSTTNTHINQSHNTFTHHTYPTFTHTTPHIHTTHYTYTTHTHTLHAHTANTCSCVQ